MRIGEKGMGLEEKKGGSLSNRASHSIGIAVAPFLQEGPAYLLRLLLLRPMGGCVIAFVAQR